jgi:hypothetical protein
VFPARYELNSYIVFRKRLVSKRLKSKLGSAQKGGGEAAITYIMY